MPPLILHQYAPSPFSEKVRLAMGVKGLRWQSVDIPASPPRPWLKPLTGGYRRTPVLQVGADIFCDTNLILPTLERLHPAPTLYPAPFGEMSKALSFSVEREIWIAAIGVLVHFVGDFPPDMLRDRKEGYLRLDLSQDAMAPDFPVHAQRVRAHLAWLAASLADGRRFLLGDEPGALDLGLFHPLWLMRARGPQEELDALLGFGPIAPWYDRVAGLGHGMPTPLEPEAAFAAAAGAEPAAVEHVAPGCPFPGLALSAPVRVTPDDNAKVPVEGTLVAMDDREIVLRREDGRAGTLHVHFPRAGFEVQAAG